jgi:D-serine deaminase-like pyridoxal phosphate-dependent protein
MTVAHEPWWRIDNADDVPSPALLIYPDRAEANIRRMVEMAGDASRLTPHVKTHKLAPLVAMHLMHGIRRFKCATIAEAEMAAASGADDVLLAYQPVGPAVARLIALAQQYPKTRFSVIADDAAAIDAIARVADAAGVTVPVLLDLDVGMHRTGIAPGPQAHALYRLLTAHRGVVPGGLHAYDGHLRDADPAVRIEKSNAAFAAVESLREALVADGEFERSRRLEHEVLLAVPYERHVAERRVDQQHARVRTFGGDRLVSEVHADARPSRLADDASQQHR